MEMLFLVGPFNVWADTDIGMQVTSLVYNGREKKQPRTSLFTSIKLHNQTSNLAAPLFYKQGRQMLRDPVQVSQQAHNRTKNRPLPGWQWIIKGPAPNLSTAKSTAQTLKERILLQVSSEKHTEIFLLAEAERDLQHLTYLSPRQSQSN